MKLTWCCALLVCWLGLTNLHGQDASKTAGKKATEANQKEVAVLKTSEGEMVMEFWPEVAPKTVENFKKLAREGLYDGTLFHRIMAGFMIQGGDPLTKDPSKESLWGRGSPAQTVPDEFNNRRHVRGVISMAHLDQPNSAGSQFFICLGTASQLDRKFTAFGKVIKGLPVLDKIGRTPVTRAADGEMSKPTVRVALESVKIVPANSIK
ncbi:MAG TPA: peptidylprolyl isomerase [Chthoniobacterales bacterium]|jgi:peptidyl-prolyl cis-trans isomerase B (cyclophilin B)|nr:peptidylprolyl isomerase [Chthoniobacterales bacterium]